MILLPHDSLFGSTIIQHEWEGCFLRTPPFFLQSFEFISIITCVTLTPPPPLPPEYYFLKIWNNIILMFMLFFWMYVQCTNIYIKLTSKNKKNYKYKKVYLEIRVELKDFDYNTSFPCTCIHYIYISLSTFYMSNYYM